MARDERIYPDLNYGNFAMHLFRYLWVLPHAYNEVVLDAGCGSGYGGALLAERRGRAPDAHQLRLIGQAEAAGGGVGVLLRHRQDLLLDLGRGLVWHPGLTPHPGGQPLPARDLVGLLDLVEVGSVDPGQLTGPGDVLQFVR